MPMVRSRYPPDWDAISLARREAAGWQCEWCGAPHGQIVLRAPGGYWSIEPAWDPGDEVWHTPEGLLVSVSLLCLVLGCDYDTGPEGQVRPICKLWNAKVVLTVAHTDLDGGDRHDKSNLMGLRALCQACHLRYDHADHIRHAAETRRRKKLQIQPELEFEETTC